MIAISLSCKLAASLPRRLTPGCTQKKNCLTLKDSKSTKWRLAAATIPCLSKNWTSLCPSQSHLSLKKCWKAKNVSKRRDSATKTERGCVRWVSSMKWYKSISQTRPLSKSSNRRCRRATSTQARMVTFLIHISHFRGWSRVSSVTENRSLSMRS